MVTSSTVSAKPTTARPKLRPIIPDQLYPLATLSESVGLGKTAIRSLRRKGLKIRYVLGRAFCMGSDFIALVEEIGSVTKW